MITPSMPRHLWQIARLNYERFSGVTPARRTWRLDGVLMWADPIEAEYEQSVRGGELKYDPEQRGEYLQS